MVHLTPKNSNTPNRNRSSGATLDCIGTSQTDGIVHKSERANLSIERAAMDEAWRHEKCVNDSPLIVIVPHDGVPGRVFQACCNDWLCPRCGRMRANEEYARLLHGADVLGDEYTLYEITVTTRGDVTSAEAEKNYLENTNTFLTACRTYAKRHDLPWYYAAVTERQKRGNPHSHLMTTFCPKDAVECLSDYKAYCEAVSRVNAKIPRRMRFSPKPFDRLKTGELFSEWLCLEAVKAGLGVQCHISEVRSIRGMSIYLAKYMFKSALEQQWPKGWKRVRYSRNWPKLERETDIEAFPLLRPADWERLARITEPVITTEPDIWCACVIHLALNVKLEANGPTPPLETLYENRLKHGRIEFGWK